MEKNKRKFFIGKFPGKQGRKWEQERLLETNAREIHRGTNARKAKRALGVLLAAALVFQTLPFGSAAASASEVRGGLCEHHRSHTPDCGYREAEPGAECAHEHTEDCYKTVEDCIHEHTESCYPADTVSESEGAPADVGERQPTECSHSCSEESGCITKELDCRHEHDDSCGYREETPGSPCTFVCEICNGGTPEDGGNDSGTGTPGTEAGEETNEPDQEAAEKSDNWQEECICEKPCKEGNGNEGCRVNQDCPVCGAEDADFSECKGKDAEEDTQKPEDTGICKHHQAHDESCGYQPAPEDGEGSPCTYDCRICPIEELIAVLPDVGSITEENAEDVRAQLEEILALFEELTEEEQEQIDLSRCYELQEALDGAKTPVPAEEILTDAVAEIVKSDGATTLVDKTAFLNAFKDSGSSGVTITMLNDVELTKDESITLEYSCTLDLNGHTISQPDITPSTFSIVSGTVTIKDSGTGGEIRSGNTAIGVSSGTVSIESGTVSGSYIGVQVTVGSVNISGTAVISGDNNVGLLVERSGSITISGGTFSGVVAVQVNNNASVSLKDMLATGCAYHQNDIPVAKAEGFVGDYEAGEVPLDAKPAWLTGTVTVKECQHNGKDVCTYTHTSGATTHQKTCLACGNKWDEENCSFGENGKCACEAVLAVTLKDNTELTYNGTEQTPEVNVTVDGTALAADNYSVAYSNNINAGENTAKVTVSGKSFTGTVTKTFTIKKATLTTDGKGTAAGTYGAKLSELTVTGPTVKLNGTEVPGTWKLAGDTIPNAGNTETRNATFTPASGGENYNPLKAQVTLNIAKAPLTVTSVTIKTRPYKYAYYAAEVSGVSFTGLVNGDTLALGQDYAAAGSYDDPNAGENKSATILVVLKSSAKANNYTLPKDSSVTATGTITAIPIADKNVTLSPASAVYDGTEQKPTVTIARLTEGMDYTVSYIGDFTKAGEHTVTVTGKGNYEGTVTKTFTIEKAEQTDFAFAAVTKPYEKNGTFTLAAAGGAGSGAVLYRVPEKNGVLMVNGDMATIIGTGTVTVTVTKAESDNYKAAMATGTVTITKATAPAITYPTAGSITYGQKLSDSALTGGSTEYGTFAWENGSTIPAVDNTGYTVVFTASEETKKNYETIEDTTQNVSVKVEKAAPAVSVTAAVSGSKDNRQAVLTVNVAKAGAGAFPTGTVTFIDCTGGTEIGTATLTGGSATCTWEGLQDKEYTVRAVYAGNNNYTEAESRELTFDAAKQDQQGFALDEIEAKTYGDAAVPLKTTGGNGSGAVRYESSDENVIRIEDDRAVITGAGTATITAIKAGDDRYNEASAGRTVTVAKKALTVRADSITVVRGDTMPLFTYKAPELVNGDTFTADPAMTAGVQDTDTLGKYDIVISGGTLRNSESYNITYVNGILNIVECFYTVTVTDGTGSGEYAEGDTVTVTADERNGYTFTGWSSGDGVTFADSKAKTTTFAMPAKAVAVKANYTRNSSGGNTGGGGGNSGGNENNGGTGGGDSGNGNNGGNGSTNPGNGNTTPQPSVTQPTDTNANPGNETAPGTGTTPVNPGTGNTVRPGTTPGSGSAGTPAQGTKQPFIKGADGKIGWDVIRAEEEQAQEGSTINVDMNGSVVVPGDIFDSIKGKDITITFDMGNGILWSVDGKSITADRAGDIDFSVKTGVNTVPVDIVNNVIGENYSIQISLAYEGEFGFTAVLSINLGKENAGYTASLYYYNESTGELEFICKDQIAEDGTVSLVFTHASDYVIAVDIESMDGKEGVDNTPKMSRTGDDSIIADVKENDEVAWIYKLVIIAVGTIVIVAGFGIIFIWKKKKEEQ